MSRLRRGATVAAALLVLLPSTGCAESTARQPDPRPLPVAADPAQCDYDRSYASTPIADRPPRTPGLLADVGGGGRNLVATPDPQASAAACRILADGGTAADAVVAAQYVLGLTEPQYSGPGGGGVLLYYDAERERTEAFDGTVYAPRSEAADPGDTGESGDTGDSGDTGADSVGVPQTDRLMATLRERYGTQTIQRLIAPARQLASAGFVVSARLAEAMAARPEVFGRRGLPKAGQTLTNPEYADYLARLADGRPAGDVVGALGAAGAEWAASRSDPIEPTEPLCVDYREHRVCGSPSTATGFMVTAQALGILDGLPLPRLGPLVSAGPGVPVARATAVHLMIEAQRMAFADANTWMTDPGADPAAAREYVRQIVANRPASLESAGRIRQRATLPAPEPAALDGRRHRYSDSTDQGTSQITVRDSAGNLASLTTTLQRSFGSGLRVAGFHLNNSLSNFTAGAAEGEPNHRAAGRHPRTMMSPAIVFDVDGPVLLLGSPGGRKIPSYVLKTIVAVLDWGLSPLQAVQMPNFGATNRNTAYLEKITGAGGAEDDLKRIAGLLRTWGHSSLRVGSYDSGLSAIGLDGDRVQAAADYRRHGLAVGVDAG